MAAGRAGRLASNFLRQKLARSHTQSLRRNKKNVRSGQGVTFEHDKAFVYRKKRMPKRKKRKWRRMIRTNTALDVKKCGSRTQVFNFQEDDSYIDSSKHGVFHTGLYTGQSILKSYLGDLQYIGSAENQGNPTELEGPTVYATTKFFFQTGVLDLTLRNDSYVVPGPNEVETPATACTLEVDVYEIISSKKWVENDNNGGVYTLKQFPNIQQLFAECQQDVPGIDNANALAYDDRGVTPWEQTGALGRYGMKILKKTKYRISYGNTITYQVRDPKNRVTSRQTLLELTGCNMPGWTRHVLFYYKAVPGINVGPVASQTTPRIRIGISRKYMYKIENCSDKRASHSSR